MRRKNDYHPLLVPAASGVCLDDGAGSNGVQTGGVDMTRDDIIRMAREAGSIDSEDVIETVYAAFAAAEREACAQLCEAEAEKWEGDDGPISTEARLCALAIRARGADD